MVNQRVNRGVNQRVNRGVNQVINPMYPIFYLNDLQRKFVRIFIMNPVSKETSQKLNEAILECEDSRPFGDSRKPGIEKQFLIDEIMVGDVKITLRVGRRGIKVGYVGINVGDVELKRWIKRYHR